MAGTHQLPDVVSAVTVTVPLNGTKRRKTRRDKGVKRTRKVIDQLDTTFTVNPMVMAKARKARRPGEHLVVISPTEVKLIPR